MCVFELVQLLCGIGPLGLIDLHIRGGMSVLLLLVLRLLAIMVSIFIFFPERECLEFNTIKTTQPAGVQFVSFFIERECTKILPGSLGSNFQYTLALEKRIHCLKSERIGKKAPLGNLPLGQFPEKNCCFLEKYEGHCQRHNGPEG